jgi:prepilin-type processing-associated H-X9-DG protein
MYLDEHDDRFPAWGTRWIDEIDSYLDIRSADDPNREVFHCPNDKGNDPAIALPVNRISNFENFGSSYSLNAKLYPSSPTDPQLMLSRIIRSLSKVYIEIDNEDNYPGHGGKGRDWQGTPVMVLFLDGHTSGPFLYRNQFEVGSRDSTKEVWWYLN